MTKHQGKKIYNTNKCFHYWNLCRRTENELSNVYCVRNKWVTLDNWDYIYMLQQHRLYKEATENDAALNIMTWTYWLTKLIRFWNLLGFSKLCHFINKANGGKSDRVSVLFLFACLTKCRTTCKSLVQPTCNLLKWSFFIWVLDLYLMSLILCKVDCLLSHHKVAGTHTRGDFCLFILMIWIDRYLDI